MIERINPSGLSTPPGYSHIVVASGSRLVIIARAAANATSQSLLVRACSPIIRWSSTSLSPTPAHGLRGCHTYFPQTVLASCHLVVLC
jgi:hypothetical protein